MARALMPTTETKPRLSLARQASASLMPKVGHLRRWKFGQI